MVGHFLPLQKLYSYSGINKFEFPLGTPEEFVNLIKSMWGSLDQRPTIDQLASKLIQISKSFNFKFWDQYSASLIQINNYYCNYIIKSSESDSLVLLEETKKKIKELKNNLDFEKSYIFSKNDQDILDSIEKTKKLNFIKKAEKELQSHQRVLAVYKRACQFNDDKSNPQLLFKNIIIKLILNSNSFYF
ncbi:hypothetical protein ACTFIU_004278 [Dictyostelium citrinum]